jgi:hypothetical protein
MMERSQPDIRSVIHPQPGVVVPGATTNVSSTTWLGVLKLSISISNRELTLLRSARPSYHSTLNDTSSSPGINISTRSNAPFSRLSNVVRLLPRMIESKVLSLNGRAPIQMDLQQPESAGRNMTPVSRLPRPVESPISPTISRLQSRNPYLVGSVRYLIHVHLKTNKKPEP